VESYSSRYLNKNVQQGVEEMFVLTKEKLDKRICDVEGVANEETYREFIRNSEDAFEMEHMDIDSLDEEELNKYLEFLDYLWTK
jgi:hypothetical protein